MADPQNQGQNPGQNQNSGQDQYMPDNNRQQQQDDQQRRQDQGGGQGQPGNDQFGDQGNEDDQQL